MRSFAKISPQFWMSPIGKRLRKLGPEAQVAALYLLSSPHSNMLGLYYLPMPMLAHETGIPFEGASKTLQSLIEADFCAYDEESEFVWVYNMALWQIGEALKPKDNQVKGINTLYSSLPDNPYLADFYYKYGESYHLKSPRGIALPPRVSEGASEPLRSKEKEKEKEREKEKEKSISVESESEFESGEPISTVDARGDRIPLQRTQSIRSPKADPEDLSEEVIQVLDHQRSYDPNYLPKPTRKSPDYIFVRNVMERTGYTAAQLCLAVDGCWSTPFNRGANKDGRMYTSLKTALKHSNLQDFMNRGQQTGAGQGGLAVSELERRNQQVHDTLVSEVFGSSGVM